MTTCPMSVGRNFHQIIRVIDALQRNDSKHIATLEDGTPVNKVIIPPTVSDEAARELVPLGWDEVRPFLRLTQV